MTNPIVDNRDRKVMDFLSERVVAGSDLSIVSAYFTIHAYKSLRDALDGVAHARFLYGDPQGIGTMDPDGGEERSFRLTEDSGMDLRHALAQKPLAQACAAWIKEKVDVRAVARAGFLHGKLYHTENARGDSAALVGSSNLTRRGLGFGAAPNIELNLEIRDEADRDRLIGWFDKLWADETLTRNAKPEVLAALERLGKAYAPQFVYYKTLFHIFEDRLQERVEQDGLLHDVHLHDTEVWKALYAFQKDGATSAINRLLRQNGCVVADSVGLGKTWTALAVIKFFELRNERVLVLCPKRLEDNWTRYTALANARNNPFEKDRLGYTVLAHTDLSRYKGKSGQVDLANFNWGAFDLVVIDESHNFRNEGRDRTDDAGEVIRRSRYNRLLEEVVKDSVRTKLLMLSATPVNTSLRDLRNQIYLMTEKRQDAFRERLGIGSIQSVFGVAQRAFSQWEKARREGKEAGDKAALLQSLGADFLSLLDAVSIARSRSHIIRYYPQVAKEIGGFPHRAKPENLHPVTDSEGALSYDDLNKRIEGYRLAVYRPSQYLRDRSALEAEKQMHRFDQSDRERWLIGMMRVNLLKRLESSAHSLALTTGRMLEKMKGIVRLIEAWQERGEGEKIDSRPDEDEEDEDFAIGKGRLYRLDELDIKRWRSDLDDDMRTFSKLHELASQVTPQRDAKLAELKRVLRDKVKTAPVDQDGHANRKALVFTSFSDTARYLYENLEQWARGELDAHIALVTGGDGNKSTQGTSDFTDILGRFAPVAQQRSETGGKIDILIATDCLSEGQNLQDCDMVVNYDIHWNPVRLMQRFGRIDRLGSRNREISMVNFWPTKKLDRYLKLKSRVEARMALADATGTGRDDPLDRDGEEELAQGELRFRDEQLLRLRDEILDIDEVEDGVSMSDLTLDDFLADLLQYVQSHRKALEAAPPGIYAIANAGVAGGGQAVRDGISPGRPSGAPGPGAIFCLRRRTDAPEPVPNALQPYFLVYVRDDGTVRYTFQQARQGLALFRDLAAGLPSANRKLENDFDVETDQGKKMERHEELLDSALRSIVATLRSAELRQLSRDRGARLTKKPERSDPSEDFELVTWLLVVA